MILNIVNLVHELVRQAATECFCNMIYHDNFIEYIINNDGDKLRLWLAFAQANIDPSRVCGGGGGGG